MHTLFNCFQANMYKDQHLFCITSNNWFSIDFFSVNELTIVSNLLIDLKNIYINTSSFIISIYVR